MKSIKLAVCAALLGTSVLTTPAMAAVILLDTVVPQGANTTARTAMQTQCTQLASAHGAAWQGTLDENSITASSMPTSGPTEVGTHTYTGNEGSNRVGAGTYKPAHKEIEGNPYRNGGSVNMFGDQIAVGGSYSSSTYDFMNKFDSTFDYSFSCKMTEKVATPALGLHSWVGPDSAAQSAKDECEFTKSAHVYDDRGANCKWTETVPAGQTEEDRSPEQGQPVSQSQQDTLKAHESAGEGYFESATQYLGQVVICISPSRTGTKLPGAWSTQNGYNGGVMGSGATASSPGCNTEWFNGGATTGVSNLNSGRHSVVTVPVV